MSRVPAFLEALIDDAAPFPPASTPLGEALEAHAEHRSAGYAALVGPLVVSDVMLPDLLEALDEATEPLPVSVVVTGGAGAIEPAARWATRSGLLAVCALETPLRDEDDLARNAARIVSAVDQARDSLGDVAVHVEPPRVHGRPTHGWLGALDQIADAGLRLKVRTGGAVEDEFPTSAELAACIDAALDRELPFKCTAGLHHAVRSGVEHGFLNVLAATGAAFEGAPPDDVVALLEDPDPGLRTDELESARRWFTSFGCCTVEDPVKDLVELGLVDP